MYYGCKPVVRLCDFFPWWEGRRWWCNCFLFKSPIYFFNASKAFSLVSILGFKIQVNLSEVAQLELHCFFGTFLISAFGPFLKLKIKNSIIKKTHINKMSIMIFETTSAIHLVVINYIWVYFLEKVLVIFFL